MAVNGEMKSGRIFVRGERLSLNSKRRRNAAGFSVVVMVLRAGFLIAQRRAIAFRGGSFPPELNGVRKPSNRPEGPQLTRWFLKPILLIFSSGQLAQQSGLRMMAQETAPRVVTKSGLHRPFAYFTPFNSTEVKIRDSALFHKAASRWGAPLRR